MSDQSAIVELRQDSAAGIFAVSFRGGKRLNTLRLPDGAIVEQATPDQRCELPACLENSFPVALDGGPASIHHVNLGLIAGFVALGGVYCLPSGAVAAVYGARGVPLGLS